MIWGSRGPILCPSAQPTAPWLQVPRLPRAASSLNHSARASGITHWEDGFKLGAPPPVPPRSMQAP